MDWAIVLVAGSTVILCDEETLSVVIAAWSADSEAIGVLSRVELEEVSLLVVDACPGAIEEDDSTSGDGCEIASVDVDASDTVGLLVSVARENSVEPVALSLTVGFAEASYVVLLGID